MKNKFLAFLSYNIYLANTITTYRIILGKLDEREQPVEKNHCKVTETSLNYGTCLANLNIIIARQPQLLRSSF